MSECNVIGLPTNDECDTERANLGTSLLDCSPFPGFTPPLRPASGSAGSTSGTCFPTRVVVSSRTHCKCTHEHALDEPLKSNTRLTVLSTRQPPHARHRWPYWVAMDVHCASSRAISGHTSLEAGDLGGTRLTLRRTTQVEGLLTVVVAALFLALFPRSSRRPVSLLGVTLFNEREARILTARVVRDDHTKIQAKQHVSRDEFKSAVSQPTTPRSYFPGLGNL